MTTYMQEEYEALALQERPIITDVKVNYTITNHPEELTDNELEKITSVFRSLETGLREASIYPNVRSIKITSISFNLINVLQDLHKAMKMLGLNPSEQEMVDIPNEIARNGLIYFPDFCQLILERLREDKYAEEDFRRFMFKVLICIIMFSTLMLDLQMLCGTEPHPKEMRAKKYKVDKHSLSKVCEVDDTNW